MLPRSASANQKRGRNKSVLMLIFSFCTIVELLSLSPVFRTFPLGECQKERVIHDLLLNPMFFPVSRTVAIVSAGLCSK